LACPFFMPTQPAAEAIFIHPMRLPLGAPWRGRCCAPGHEAADLSIEELKDCNLGNAKQCVRLPTDRISDAVRFAVARESGNLLALRFVCEKNYRPASDGTLEYDSLRQQWNSIHNDPQIQRMAQCFLQSYLSRKVPMEADSTSSPHS
jgi:hypothetical protein